MRIDLLHDRTSEAPLNLPREVVRSQFPNGEVSFEIGRSDFLDSVAVVDCRAGNGNELMEVLSLVDSLGNRGWGIDLRIWHLMGMRMDRRIGAGTFTAKVVADALTSTGRPMLIEVFAPHSPAIIELLNAHDGILSRAISPWKLVRRALQGIENPIIVAPDKGAAPWVSKLAESLEVPSIPCRKERDVYGKLVDFRMSVYDEGRVSGRNALIVDDLCDAGGTFEGVAKLLRDEGANSVHLCVAHGLFTHPTKGFSLEGIDSVITTNAYRDRKTLGKNVTIVNVRELYDLD